MLACGLGRTGGLEGLYEFLQVKNYPDEGGLFRSGGMGRIVEACYSDALFWPCDAHGNKVRWPKVPA